jgi:hypothetical protein
MDIHIEVTGDAVSYMGYTPSEEIVSWFKEHDISIEEYVHGELTDEQLSSIPEGCDFWDMDNEEPKDGWCDTEFEGGVLLENSKMVVSENNEVVLEEALSDLTADSWVDKFTVGIDGVIILRKNNLGINYKADIESEDSFNKDELDFNVIEDQLGKRIYCISYGVDCIGACEDEDYADGCVEVEVISGS